MTFIWHVPCHVQQISAHLLWPAKPFHVVGSMCKDSSSMLVHVHCILCYAPWTTNLGYILMLTIVFCISLHVLKLCVSWYQWFAHMKVLICDLFLINCYFSSSTSIWPFFWQSVTEPGAVGAGWREQCHGVTHMLVAWSPTSRWWSWSCVWPRTRAWSLDFLLHIRACCRAMAAVPQLFLACVSDAKAILLVMFGGLWRVIKIYP
jgi:hypothetical protein